jgi:hypothetical protein
VLESTSKFDVLRESCKRLPHGTRGRYVAGCKCMRCRAANSRYNTERERERKDGDVRHIVPADRAQAHLLKLSKLGIGRRAVAAASDISGSILLQIRSGRRKNIRASTERRILSVDSKAVSGGALIPAAPTWRLLNKLLERGYTKAQLAIWMGFKTPALQIKRDVITAETAVKVERLYRLIEAGKLRRGERAEVA